MLYPSCAEFHLSAGTAAGSLVRDSGESRNTPWRKPSWSEWDWWPLARLVALALFAAGAAHFVYGWRFSGKSALIAAVGVFENFSLVAAFSSTLAYLYAAVFLFPLCGVIVLNEWLYDAPAWLLRKALRVRSNRVLMPLGLGCELALFSGLYFAGQWFVSRL